jgi:hypothetical protein
MPKFVFDMWFAWDGRDCRRWLVGNQYVSRDSWSFNHEELSGQHMTFDLSLAICDVVAGCWLSGAQGWDSDGRPGSFYRGVGIGAVFCFLVYRNDV